MPPTPAPREPRKAAASAAVPVTTAPAQVEDFAIRRRTIGIIESPATVVVKSRLESQVTEQHVRDGQLVKKGDLLFTLDDRVVQAAIARDEAQLAKDQATARPHRSSIWSATSDCPKQCRRPASSSTRRPPTTRSPLAVVGPTRRSSGPTSCASTTPRSTRRSAAALGTVSVTPGNLVSVNDPTGLVTITQVKPIRVSFTLPERDLAALRKAIHRQAAGAGARLRAGRHRSCWPPASSTSSTARVDTASGTIAAKAIFAERRTSSSGPACMSTSRSTSRSVPKTADDPDRGDPERPERAVCLRRRSPTRRPRCARSSWSASRATAPPSSLGRQATASGSSSTADAADRRRACR